MNKEIGDDLFNLSETYAEMTNNDPSSADDYYDRQISNYLTGLAMKHELLDYPNPDTASKLLNQSRRISLDTLRLIESYLKRKPKAEDIISQISYKISVSNDIAEAIREDFINLQS